MIIMDWFGIYTAAQDIFILCHNYFYKSTYVWYSMRNLQEIPGDLFFKEVVGMRNGRKSRSSMGWLIAILVVGVVTYVFYHTHNTTGGQRPETKIAAPLTPAQATSLADELNSHDKAQQSKALAPLLQSGSWDPNTVMPQDTTLTIDVKSFRDYGNGFSTVEATATDAAKTQFKLDLQSVNGRWLISETTRK